MKSWITTLGIAAAAGVYAGSAPASEWGCEVLLCASSSNPSWHGVPACHPPMNRLISAMKRPGFSWPTCPEAGTGRPGYEQFEDCPDGWAEADDPNSDQRGGVKSHCVRMVNICGEGRRVNFGGDGESCTQAEHMARAQRQEPYYFAIISVSDNTTKRHWFSLRK